MAGADELLEVAQSNFEGAHANLDQDLADATTPAATRAVMENHDKALAAYMRAIRVSMESSSGNWQQALADAKQAQADIQKARTDAVSFDAKLVKLTAATTKVADAITAATA